MVSFIAGKGVPSLLLPEPGDGREEGGNFPTGKEIGPLGRGTGSRSAGENLLP